MIGAEKLDQLVQFFNFIYTVVNIDSCSVVVRNAMASL